MSPAPSPQRILAAVALTALPTGVAHLAGVWMSHADVVMLYLLAVAWAAYRLGRVPSLVAAGASVLAFNFFFVEPRYTFAVADPRNLLTFAMLFAVGWGLSTLTDRLRIQELELARRRADEIRNALLASVSHDLRTPLAGITGSASALLDAEAPVAAEDRDGLVRSIRDEAVRLERLVGNLLELARLRSGPPVLRLEWVPVDELIGPALARTSAALAGRRVEVILPPGVLLVHVDAVLFGQALYNLLDNVGRHTPSGTAVRIEAGQSVHGARISVIDTGPGLPRGAPFLRFRGVEADAGLGLAIVEGVAKAHGGQLHVENLPSGGAAMSILLPASPAPPHLGPP